VRGALQPAGPRLLVALTAAAMVLGAGSIGRAEPGPGLTQQAASLRAEEHAALLQLYGLDSQLEAARSELDGIRARLAEITREQNDARAQLRVARLTLALSELRLGRTLVALYESERTDPLAVIFGATSLADAISGLDNLTRVASSHAEVAADARTARRRIAEVSRALSTRAAEARRLEQAADAKTAELARAREERSAYLERVRAESAVVAERIATVEAQARAAQARAETVSTQAAAAGSVAGFGTTPQPVEPAPAAPVTEIAAPLPEEAAPIQAPVSGARTLTVSATAYSIKGTTSTGIPTGYGVVAVDPTVIPLGTRMTIPGYGEGVAADTGSGVRGATIDVWLPTHAQAAAWGTKTVTITLH
jgi:3D (Asp-Asp-Asp) domain-containing protein/peptidoglycan hydrolase CwlO-like protein